MTSDVLTLKEAERLAEATLLQIKAEDVECMVDLRRRELGIHRERVESDLDGLQYHAAACWCIVGLVRCDDVLRYSDGLRRTAALYGVEVKDEAKPVCPPSCGIGDNPEGLHYRECPWYSWEPPGART